MGKDEGDGEVEQSEGSPGRVLVVPKLAARHSARVQGEKGREDDGERQRGRRARVCVSGFGFLCASALAEHRGGRGRGG